MNQAIIAEIMRSGEPDSILDFQILARESAKWDEEQRDAEFVQSEQVFCENIRKLVYAWNVQDKNGAASVAAAWWKRSITGNGIVTAVSGKSSYAASAVKIR